MAELMSSYEKDNGDDSANSTEQFRASLFWLLVTFSWVTLPMTRRYVTQQVPYQPAISRPKST
jgi:hypothetical protein